MIAFVVCLQARHEHSVPVVEEAPVCLGDYDFIGIPDMSNDLYIELEDLIGPSSPPPPPPPAQAGGHGNSSSDGQT